ncbi:hypothetical protein [uncultured Eudoraea sp.]|uniref:hypothetical protein n=1 Tax=uncultured Eudoraea sp. TaxID=1035614 RepID=UPI0026035D21|nr:hypothetical protein [uncultured Eudoraea sp.]
MKRILIDYKKLNHDVTSLLIETYPYGYGDEDIIAFRNVNGEFIEAVELQTADTLYLIKISKSLSHFIANFDENIAEGIEAIIDESIEGPSLELNIEEENEDEKGFD